MEKTNRKDSIIFSIIFLFTLLVFYNFVAGHFATDTYNILNRGIEEYAITYSLNDGRPINCIALLLANLVRSEYK